MNSLVLPLPTLRLLLRQLSGLPGRSVFLQVNTGQTSTQCQWLSRGLSLDPPPASQRAFLVTSSGPGVKTLPWPVAGYLCLPEDARRGPWWGAVAREDSAEPLHRCLLAGAGMHQLVLGEVPEPSENDRERWSRTIGALGNTQIWQRLVALPMAVIGCGRLGSLLAVALAQLGLRRLTLIDPDVLELHNLGEMDGVVESALGLPKVQSLAEDLEARFPVSVEAFASSASTESALQACKNADVLCCCADQGAARLTAALVAALYHKVLLDIGSGIFYPAQSAERPRGSVPARLMGSDLRLILPGDGCLLCRGNLTHYDQALDDLSHHRALENTTHSWSEQRAGSLHSLNQLAVGVAMQMLQDLVAERITSSVWAQLTFDEAGRLRAQYPALEEPSPSTCPLCAKAGLGDEGLRWGRRTSE